MSRLKIIELKIKKSWKDLSRGSESAGSIQRKTTRLYFVYSRRHEKESRDRNSLSWQKT